MPLNTPHPMQFTRGTAAKIDAHAGKQGEIVVDTDGGTVAVFSQESEAHRLARADTVIQSESELLSVNGGTSADLTGDLSIGLANEVYYADVPLQDLTDEQLAILPDTAVVTFPGPSRTGLTIDDFESKVERALTGSVTINVGGEGASRNARIPPWDRVRADGTGVPFPNMFEALRFARAAYPNAEWIFRIKGDISDLSDIATAYAIFNILRGERITIEGDESLDHPVWSYDNLNLVNCDLQIKNITLNSVKSVASNCAIMVSSGASCFVDNCVFNRDSDYCIQVVDNSNCYILSNNVFNITSGVGCFAVVYGGVLQVTGTGNKIQGSVSNAGFVLMTHGTVRITNAITGTLTGKKYTIGQHGVMNTTSAAIRNALPGGTAGTVDNTSNVYPA